MADIRDVESLKVYLFRKADDDRVKDPYKRAKIHAYRDAFERLLASPIITAVPKHGHWIDRGGGQECSVCGEIQYGYDSYRNYCACCGADMREVEK